MHWSGIDDEGCWMVSVMEDASVVSGMGSSGVAIEGTGVR